MPPTPILCDDHHSNSPIKPKTSTRLTIIIVTKFKTMIQNHDHNFDRYRSSISLLDEQLYCLLSFVPLLQPVQFSLSGADDRPLIALSTTLLSIAIDDNIFQVQLFVTRNILLPVVLGIDFLQTHGRIISFPNKQLYLTTSSSKLADKPINTNRIYNHPYTPPYHTIPFPT